MLTKRFWLEGPGSFALAVMAALLIRWLVLEAYVIPSPSMLPSLLIHDHIFVNKIVYGVRVPFTENWLWLRGSPKRGEVIVFKYPENKDLFYIKRVVGEPGDKVLIENGSLYINDKIVEKTIPEKFKFEADFLRDEDFRGEGQGALSQYVHWEEKIDEHPHSILVRKDAFQSTFGPYTVPENHFFVMGDNRDNSEDSRLWTDERRFVPRDYLIGRAGMVWLSCEETLPHLTFLCNPLKIRWNRFFHSVN